MQKKLFTFPFHLVSQLQISPFFAKFYFLYPLKIPGKPKVFCCFQGTLARNGLTHEKAMLASHRNYSVQQPVEVFNKKAVLKDFTNLQENT